MTYTRYLPFVGRLFIGLPFMMTGLDKLAAYNATIGLIAAAKLPLPPLAYAGDLAVEIGCGLLIVMGYQTRIAAGVLAVFCLVTAFLFHSNFSDPSQVFNFIKNLIMTGGLLQVVSFGAGALSLDARLSNGRARTGGAAASG